MRRTSAVLLVAALALAAAPLSVASAAPIEGCTTAIVSSAMTPSKVVIGVKTVKTSVFTVKLDNTCDNPAVFVNLASAQQVGVNLTMTAEPVNSDGTTDFTGTATWDPADFDNASYSGSWISFIDAFSDNGPFLENYGSDFSVLRAATLTMKGMPSRVTVGDSVDVAGSLTRADWDTRRYVPFGGQRVELQFKDGSGPWTTVKISRSGINGSVFSAVTAKDSGCYRYLFRGDDITTSTPSPTSCVTTD